MSSRKQMISPTHQPGVSTRSNRLCHCDTLFKQQYNAHGHWHKAKYSSFICGHQ